MPDAIAARMLARESSVTTQCVAVTPLKAKIMATDHNLPRSFVS
jgi:hypothetical protein